MLYCQTGFQGGRFLKRSSWVFAQDTVTLYLKLAIRSLIRNGRRTLLTISGMAMGFAVLLWMQCLLKGTNQQIVDNVTSTQVGHLQIWAKEYVDDPLNHYSFSPKLDNFAEILPPGSRFTSRVHLPSLISSGEQSAPISLTGIDPKTEGAVTNLQTNLVAGAFLSNGLDPECDGREIYLGRSLAKLLRVDVGEKVVIMAQATDGTLGNELLRVRGLFETGSTTFDRTVAYAPMGCVKKIGVIQGQHEVTIRLSPTVSLDAATAMVTPHLPKIAPGLKLTTWKDVVPALAGMVNFNDASLLIVSLVLFGVATFGVVNTLLMSVFERTREFGVMLALGVTPAGVCTLVLLEALLIGLLSVAVGTAAGALAVAYHQRFGFDLKPYLGVGLSVNQFKLDTIIHPFFSFGHYAFLASCTVVIATVVGIIPALRASKMNVIEAIRFR
jgi:ABC-type lipoprotein release transport system permease subunit